MREDYYAEYFRLEDTHWFFVGRRRNLLALLDHHVGPAPDGEARRILDFGCGTGGMLRHLSRYGEPEGVDVDEQAIKFCRERGLGDVTLLEGADLPYEDGTFSVVTAFDVFEHIEDDGRAMREVARVLKPDGTLLVAVPAYQWMWGRQDVINRHFRRYTSKRLRTRLTEAGFSVERLTYFNTLLFPPIAAIRLARRLLPLSDRSGSDFEGAAVGRLNDLLSRVFGGESRWLESRNLPFGVSLAAIAHPADAD